jgi:iron complex outermembrane receptor protein
MRSRCYIPWIVATLAPVAAHAQRADDNAVTAAEDAFGARIGNQSIGIYNESQVRGFSPVTAGNVRIEGVYFDRQGLLPPRLVESSTVRVGLSAQSYAFPAPTGVVDYHLHRAGAERVLSMTAARNAFNSPAIEVDGKLPILADRLGIAAGVSFADEEYLDGADADYFRAAIVPRWVPFEDAEIIAFWSIDRGSDEEVAPTIMTRGNYLPPQIPRRRYFGQPWAQNQTWSTNDGVIAKTRIGADWALSLGAFESVLDIKRGFAEIYDDTTPEGRTHEYLFADPRQRYASKSGEAHLTRTFVDGKRLHVMHVSLRTRRQNNRYGGSAEPLDLGERQLGNQVVVAEPQFVFGERTRDAVNQSTLGLAYEGRWRDVGELSLGVQRTDYEKRVDQPGLERTTTRDQPTLFSGALSAYLTDSLAAYAGYTRGLEENGLAPNDAVNRNQALPAIESKQMDAGLRWSVSSELSFIAGVFNVEKPYFSTTTDGVFTALGTVRHRGIELSLAGAPTEALTVVAGAVLMQPRVTGAAVDNGSVGHKPVGQTDRNLQIDLEYRAPLLPGWSFDTALTHYGARTASLDSRNEIPSYTVMNLGARYRFNLGEMPTTLRLLAENIADEFSWDIYSPNGFGLTEGGRRFSAQLAVDLYL